MSPAKHSSASVTDGQTDRQTDRRTDGRTDDGQSDPYVSLCFAGDTKIIRSKSLFPVYTFTFNVVITHGSITF